jgi:hypothetical protein
MVDWYHSIYYFFKWSYNEDLYIISWMENIQESEQKHNELKNGFF